MKYLAILFIFISIELNAQKLTEWRGGAPGRERDWNCSKNWSTGRVPDEFSDVIIPDCSGRGGFYPVVKDVVEVNSITFVEIFLENYISSIKLYVIESSKEAKSAVVTK
ncbi:MAG: hypothetical protein KBF59_05525 [Ignavibacterium sp.]|jgi:hypothetical protein|nr:hypothetical protein [Ignavibacterium sp.]